MMTIVPIASGKYAKNELNNDSVVLNINKMKVIEIKVLLISIFMLYSFEEKYIQGGRKN